MTKKHSVLIFIVGSYLISWIFWLPLVFKEPGNLVLINIRDEKYKAEVLELPFI